MGKKTKIFKVVNVVIAVVFACSNNVWAIPGQNVVLKETLAQQSMVNQLVGQMGILNVTAAYHNELLEKGITDMSTLMQRLPEVERIARERYLEMAKKSASDIEGFTFRTFVLGDTEGGIVYYTLAPEGDVIRYSTKSNPKSQFGNLINPYITGRTEEISLEHGNFLQIIRTNANDLLNDVFSKVYEAKASPLLTFHKIGEQIWLDGLTVEMLEDGGLFEQLVRDHGITGVTTNPILIKAYFNNPKVLHKAKTLARQGLSTEDIYYEIVKDLAEKVIGIFKKYGVKGKGKFSVELDPTKADDIAASVEEAKKWTDIEPDYMMVKVAANEAGYKIIEEVIAIGRNVNATLIFSPEQYSKVVEAYLRGLQRASTAGINLSKVYSVASFFISRWDVRFIDTIPTEYQGMFANAVTIEAYNKIFIEKFGPDEFNELKAKRANVQDFLLASTGSKAKSFREELREFYPPDVYVRPVQGPHVVNTLPIGTIQFLMKAKIEPKNTIIEYSTLADKIMAEMRGKGIDIEEEGKVLFTNGMKDFIKDFNGVIATLEEIVKNSRIEPDDFMKEIDHVMQMLGLNDYPRIMQLFNASIDPVTLVNELVAISGKDADTVLKALETVPFFKTIALDYRVRNTTDFNPAEYSSKTMDVVVGAINYALIMEEQQPDIQGEPLSDYIIAKRNNAKNVPFAFRDNMEAFVSVFLKGVPEGEKNDLLAKISQIKDFFASLDLSKIKYIISSGIGANEMYSHQLAQIINAFFNGKVKWIVVNNPAHQDPNIIPEDANNENTVVFEMSRSGSTQETVDFFNATKDRFKKRIVAANSGALKEGSLKLQEDPKADICNIDDIPGDIGGRQMNRKTLMVYVPLFMALMVGTKDTKTAEDLLRDYVEASLESNTSLAYQNGLESESVRMAEFLLRLRTGAGREKFAVIWDPSLKAISKEFVQLMNEGANKNIAGATNRNILDSFNLIADMDIYNRIFYARPDEQMLIFLLNKNSPNYQKAMMYVKSLRNKGIPCIVVTANLLDATDDINRLKYNLKVLARTSNLLQDMVVYFTYLTNQDANSNPAVKFVREITAAIFEILKDKKASGAADIRITLADVMKKIAEKKKTDTEKAKSAVDKRDKKGEYRTEFNEFKNAIEALAEALGIDTAVLTAIIIEATSKSVIQTDVGEAGGSKIAEITEAFSRLIFARILGAEVPQAAIDALEKQIYLSEKNDRVAVSVAVEKTNPIQLEQGDMAEKIADYLYAMYKEKGRAERLTHMPLICMEADQENPIIRDIVKDIVDQLADLGVSVPKLALPGAAHTGIEAIMSHPENIIVIGIVSTQANGGELGRKIVAGQITIDDATYVYGIGNIARMALGGSPSVVFEITDANDLQMVKDTLQKSIKLFKTKIEDAKKAQGSHIVRAVKEGEKEEPVRTILKDETGRFVSGNTEDKDIIETLNALANEEKYGLGFLLEADQIEVVRNLRADLYGQARAPLAVFVEENGIRKIKVDESIERIPLFLREEFVHELKEPIASLIPGSNRALSDVVSTVGNVRDFLALPKGEQNQFLGLLQTERTAKKIDPDQEYEKLLSRLNGIKNNLNLDDFNNELIASVVRYVLKTKVYEGMLGELGLPEELAEQIKNLEPKTEDLLAVFNLIANAKVGAREAGLLIQKVAEQDRITVGAIKVLKTYSGKTRISGTEGLSHEFARLIIKLVNIASKKHEVEKLLSDKVNTDLQKKTDTFCIVIPKEEKLIKRWENDIKCLQTYTNESEQQIFTIVTSLEEAEAKGFKPEQITRFMDFIDMENINDKEKEKGYSYLPMMYQNTSLYAAAHVAVAHGDINALDLVVRSLIEEFCGEILASGEKVDDVFLSNFLRAPWKLPRPEAVLMRLNDLRKALEEIDKAA